MSSAAKPTNAQGLKAYAAGVALILPPGSEAKTTSSILCETSGAAAAPTAPALAGTALSCGGTDKQVTK